MRKILLSILDQTPVSKGACAEQALKESVILAKRADELGYTRYWLSEHHNTGSLAGSAPELLIAHIGSKTHRIRLGSGGIMLPNHSALKVAENFRTLEVLFPGRIDLGIGRAPGGDRLAATLLNPSNNFHEEGFIRQLIDLQHFLDIPNDYEKENYTVQAIPGCDRAPDLWLLSSSGQSGLIAARFGMALSFAHFINPSAGPDAVRQYREHFRPSEILQEPRVNVAVFVLCADTHEKAAELKKAMDIQMLMADKGMPEGISSYEEVKQYPLSEADEHRISLNEKRIIWGTPGSVKSQLLDIAEEYDTDEVIAVTITHAFSDRLRSYELLAQQFGIVNQ